MNSLLDETLPDPASRRALQKYGFYATVQKIHVHCLYLKEFVYLSITATNESLLYPFGIQNFEDLME